ncbi:hypothetical protein HYT84_05000 [Candidatus Micrarchaeota archaeon]|nr:hypothetical protein [Candidatus Micrarchaeota archaeon]
MPSDVLERIQKPEYSNLVVIYIGKKELTYKGSVKNEDWYSKLSPDFKNRLIVMEGTVDELLDKKNFTINDYILKNEWMLRAEKTIDLSHLKNISMITFGLNNGSNIRLLYKNQLVDYPAIKKDKAKIDAATNLFPWEKSRVYFTIFQTNGTAHLVVEKDGTQIKDEKLVRVTSESIFLKFLEFSDPGDYLVKIKDNDEVQATAIIHIKDLTVNLVEVRDGIYHVFNFAIDGEPIKQANVTVMLKGSENQKQFFITNGDITVPAKLAKGTNAFVFRIYGGELEVEIVNKSEDILGIYLTYGPIGLGLIIIIFIFARLNKKPVYTLRVGNVVQEIRKELRTNTKQALDIFKTTRTDLGINGPLKAQEYGVGLKRHLTEGADVTEGNVEEILRKLEELTFVQSYKGYYQLKEEGTIKKNVLQRIIREKLIERGISFKFKASKFITKEHEIGFFGDKLRKRAIFVFEDAKDIKDTLNQLSDKERSIFFLKEFNGIIELTTIDKLEESL